MPDLVTHVSIAYLFKYFFSELRENRLFFYMGTILPDITTRTFYILIPDLYWFVFPLHTLSGMFLFGLLFAYLFKAHLRKVVLLSVYAGYLLHFHLDAMQQDIFREYYWFYPFSDQHISFDLFGIDDSIRMMPLFVLIVLAVELILRLRSVSAAGNSPGN